MKARYIIGGLLALAIIGAAASTTKTSSTGTTNSPALVAPGAKPTPAAKPAAPQTFKGNGSENLGTINVPTQSTLTWSCPSCANNNFIIGNKISDAGTINVNALGPQGGKTALDAGTYHDVDVNTTGQAWTITVTAR